MNDGPNGEQQDDRRIDLANMRISYAEAGLDVDDLAPNWTAQFEKWMAEAVSAGLTEPNAMVLATADADGTPSSRTVLAKSVDDVGVTFFTNYTSKKSSDLAANPRVSATFPWIDLQRQVHFRGRVERVDPDTTAAYWATRWRGSQLGAWASPQSTTIQDRAQLDQLEAQMEAKFADVADIPVPPNWGGWRIVAESVEFWQGRRGRMHDRLVFRTGADGTWAVERLAP